MDMKSKTSPRKPTIEQFVKDAKKRANDYRMLAEKSKNKGNEQMVLDYLENADLEELRSELLPLGFVVHMAGRRV